MPLLQSDGLCMRTGCTDGFLNFLLVSNRIKDCSMLCSYPYYLTSGERLTFGDSIAALLLIMTKFVDPDEFNKKLRQ